MSRLKNDPMQ